MCSAAWTMEENDLLVKLGDGQVSSLLHAASSKSHADVELRNSSPFSECFAHRLILSSVSPFLCKLLYDIPVGQLVSLVLPETSSDVLKLFTDFIYCGVVCCNEELYVQFIELIQLLGIDQLDNIIATQDEPNLCTVELSPRKSFEYSDSGFFGISDVRTVSLEYTVDDNEFFHCNDENVQIEDSEIEVLGGSDHCFSIADYDDSISADQELEDGPNSGSEPLQLNFEVNGDAGSELSSSDNESLFPTTNDYQPLGLNGESEPSLLWDGSLNGSFHITTLNDVKIPGCTTVMANNARLCICNECHLHFTTLESFSTHCSTVHGRLNIFKHVGKAPSRKNEPHNSNLQESGDKDDAKSSAFVCDIPSCAKQFNTNFALRKHKSRLHTKSCDVISNISLYDSSNNMLPEVDIKPNLFCLENGLGGHSGNATQDLANCESGKIAASDLLPHNDSIDDEAMSKQFPMKCILCGKCLDNVRQFQQHTVWHQVKNPSRKCNTCKMGFARPQVARQHIENIHLNVFRHVCTSCGKGFNRPVFLSQHQRIFHPDMMGADSESSPIVNGNTSEQPKYLAKSKRSLAAQDVKLANDGNQVVKGNGVSRSVLSHGITTRKLSSGSSADQSEGIYEGVKVKQEFENTDRGLAPPLLFRRKRGRPPKVPGLAGVEKRRRSDIPKSDRPKMFKCTTCKFVGESRYCLNCHVPPSSEAAIMNNASPDRTPDAVQLPVENANTDPGLAPPLLFSRKRGRPPKVPEPAAVEKRRRNDIPKSGRPKMFKCTTCKFVGKSWHCPNCSVPPCSEASIRNNTSNDSATDAVQVLMNDILDVVCCDHDSVERSPPRLGVATACVNSYSTPRSPPILSYYGNDLFTGSKSLPPASGKRKRRSNLQMLTGPSTSDFSPDITAPNTTRIINSTERKWGRKILKHDVSSLQDALQSTSEFLRTLDEKEDSSVALQDTSLKRVSKLSPATSKGSNFKDKSAVNRKGKIQHKFSAIKWSASLYDGYYPCDHCNKLFYSKTTYGRHVVVAHSKEVKYKCETPKCEKRFAYLSDFNRHILKCSNSKC